MKTLVHRQFPPAPKVGPRVPPASICVHLRPSAVSPHSALRTPHSTGFSLVEILVTMALLSVIVLGLLAMFHQTQRAFTQSLMQVDVLEAGRAATDLISHELEQMTPAYASNGVNFYAALEPGAVAVKQPLTVFPEIRTNVMEQFFFLTRYNQQWKGIGYRLGTPTNAVFPPIKDGVGTLYRYDSYYTNDLPINLWRDFTNASSTNFQRIADGVVHLRIRAYDLNGFYINWYKTNFNDVIDLGSMETDYALYSNAVPASVEVELGFLETRTLEHFRSMEIDPSNPTITALSFLTNHSGQVHLFSKRVQIRNVDAAAYR
jgi:prepilin-type N-terminal cleavage/methylation domain-containing protein